MRGPWCFIERTRAKHELRPYLARLQSRIVVACLPDEMVFGAIATNGVLSLHS